MGGHLGSASAGPPAHRRRRDRGRAASFSRVASMSSFTRGAVIGPPPPVGRRDRSSGAGRCRPRSPPGAPSGRAASGPDPVGVLAVADLVAHDQRVGAAGCSAITSVFLRSWTRPASAHLHLLTGEAERHAVAAPFEATRQSIETGRRTTASNGRASRAAGSAAAVPGPRPRRCWCPSPGSAAGPPAPPTARRSRPAAARGCRRPRGGVDRLAQIANMTLDLALALRVARLAGIDMEPQLHRKTPVGFVDHAPGAGAPGDRRLHVVDAQNRRHPAQAPEAGDLAGLPPTACPSTAPRRPRASGSTASRSAQPGPPPRRREPPPKLRPVHLRLRPRPARPPAAAPGSPEPETSASSTAAPTSGCHRSHARAGASHAAPRG